MQLAELYLLFIYLLGTHLSPIWTHFLKVCIKKHSQGIVFSLSIHLSMVDFFPSQDNNNNNNNNNCSYLSYNSDFFLTLFNYYLTFSKIIFHNIKKESLHFEI